MIERVIMDILEDGDRLRASGKQDAVSLARMVLARDFDNTVSGRPKIDRNPLILAIAELVKPTTYGLEDLARRLHAVHAGKTLAEIDERTAIYHELGRYSRVWCGSDELSDYWHRKKYGEPVLACADADHCWIAAAHRDLTQTAEWAAKCVGQEPVAALLRPHVQR